MLIYNLVIQINFFILFIKTRNLILKKNDSLNVYFKAYKIYLKYILKK